MSDHSLRKILHSSLHTHPYQMMVVQKLNDSDYPINKTCVRIFWRAVLISCDEAHFHLSEMVKSLTIILKKSINGHFIVQKLWCHVPLVILVWVRISLKGAVLQRQQHHSTVVNFFHPKVNVLFNYHDIEDVWFHKDGTPSHISRSLGILRNLLSGILSFYRVILVCHHVCQIWPDVIFFLCG